MHANNKSADHPTHPSSLISAFVFRSLLESVIYEVVICQLLICHLVYVAEQAGLSIETPEAMFSRGPYHLVSTKPISRYNGAI